MVGRSIGVGPTGVHEAHGLIAKTYREEGGDASRLGLPVSDEETSSEGRVSLEHAREDHEPKGTQIGPRMVFASIATFFQQLTNNYA
jgi:hypothetical protein